MNIYEKQWYDTDYEMKKEKEKKNGIVTSFKKWKI